MHRRGTGWFPTWLNRSIPGARVAEFSVVVLVGLLYLINGIKRGIDDNDAQDRILIDRAVEIVAGAIK